MGIKVNGLNDIMGNLDNILGAVVSAVQDAVEKACWDTVAEARATGSYQDQTGNLRASIGYMIKNKGKIVSENFKDGYGRTGGTDGMNKAHALADRVSSIYGDQLVAVLVAGEDYAVYVESMGFEVISGSMLHFAKRFEQNFKAMGGNMSGIKIKKGVGNK